MNIETIDRQGAARHGLRTSHDYFLAAAREVEDIICAHAEVSDRDLAEGYLYLAGMWVFHLERVFKGHDVDRPCFVRDMDPTRTWGLPTPDHHYYSAQIDGRGEYRILGHRGATADYCFEVLSGLAGDDGVIGDRVDALDASRLKTEADGRFELFVGGVPRASNWLKGGDNARVVFVRQTVSDWTREQPTPMLIERIDIPERRFERPSAEAVQAQLKQAADRLVQQVRFLDDFSRNWANTLPVNVLPAPAVGPADSGYFPGQFNTKCRFELPEGHALVLTCEAAPARYQSLALANPHWFNSIHYRNLQSSLTLSQSRPSSDGLYRFVIGPEDPGVYNWLDTGGQSQGFLFLRYQGLADGRPPQRPKTALLPLADLSKAFPEDEERVSEAARVEMLRQRRLSADRRFA